MFQEKVDEWEQKIEESIKENMMRKYGIQYFLFDNSMHDIRYCGIDYEFLWHWDQAEDVTLFCNISS